MEEVGTVVAWYIMNASGHGWFEGKIFDDTSRICNKSKESWQVSNEIQATSALTKIHVGTSSQRSIHLSNSNQHKPNKPNSPLISHPLPPLPLIPILRIATLITQHTPSIPPPHHNTKSITHTSHQPVRSPRKRQRNLCTVQHKQQLRQRRLHVLRVAVVEVRVDVAETAYHSGSMPSKRVGEWMERMRAHSQLRTRPVSFRILSTRRRRDIRADLNCARPIVRVVDFERMTCPRWDAHRLRIRGRDQGVFAFEGEDIASVSRIRCSTLLTCFDRYRKVRKNGSGERKINGTPHAPFADVEVLVLIPVPYILPQ